jgi:hypothetical protein
LALIAMRLFHQRNGFVNLRAGSEYWRDEKQMGSDGEKQKCEFVHAKLLHSNEWLKIVMDVLAAGSG